MIEDATIRAVSHHGIVHSLGMCTCPCYEALLAVGRKLQEERELAVKIGSVSPIALAALMGADVSGVRVSDDSVATSMPADVPDRE